MLVLLITFYTPLTWVSFIAFAGAGNSATTWSVGNISNWDLSSLTNSACNAFLQLGTAATNNLASVKSAWGC